ncbi:MAG TPA: indole-3-glycerol phosphate synthase TrpC [Gemmatales bacterium]|nr:indole-3-glycerol phosphate synthase TrpC [Gemmatales bacterium]
MTGTILDRIVASKQAELAALPPPTQADWDRAAGLPPPRPFLAALKSAPGLAVIGELKRASPSAGSFGSHVDLVAQARLYAAHGAAAISVLTDGPFFLGSLADLEQVRAAVDVPLLRKDFIIDERQVLEARLAGADACLLIAEILEDEPLERLRQRIETLGMAALVECHDPEQLERLVAAGVPLIGINNRDLRTFTVRLEQTLELAKHVPSDRVLVSESGIRTAADAARLAESGVRALLVGETLMRSGDVAGTLRALRLVSAGAGGPDSR